MRSDVTRARRTVMRPTKEFCSFRGAAELVHDCAQAHKYLKEVSVACEAGDKAAAQRALRLAINELETARAGLQIGMD